MKDRLISMFDLRKSFMQELRKSFPDAYPELPIDLKEKESQQLCRDMALRGVEEMFEALQHLKNWKPHRVTNIEEFDDREFLEEIVDAFNYFFSLVILAGYDADDLYRAYVAKDKIIHDRLKNGY